MPGLLCPDREPHGPLMSAHDPPWMRSWWYCAPGQGATLAWLLLIHCAAGIGLVVVAAPPSLRLLGGSYILALLGALGLTLAYHRGLAHRSVFLHPAVEQVLLFFAVFNGCGDPANWAATHRLHHRHVDTPQDVSSPKVGGFFWAHLRWLWQVPAVSPDAYPAFLRQQRYLRWRRWQPIILVISLLGPMALGLGAWVWLGPLRLVYVLHAQCLINSAAHMRPCRTGEDSSRNLLWLGLLQSFIGESWHRNHHRRPAAARIGSAWWEVDLGWYLIRALAALGLARVRGSFARVHPGAR
jgi:fatty-acid desaturase